METNVGNVWEVLGTFKELLAGGGGRV